MTTTTSGTAADAPNAQPAAPVLTKEDIWRKLDELLPILKDRADEVREAGGLPEDLRALVRASGAWRIAFPAAMGGPEFGYWEQIEYIARIAEVSPSVGWLEMILADSGYFAQMLPDAVARELFPSIDTAAAAGRGRARAEVVDGGILFNGTFPFVSGIRDADLVSLRAPLFDRDGTPVRRDDGSLVSCAGFMPVSAVEVHDSWDVDGMRGSGSVRVTANDVFVPDRLWADMRVDGEVPAHGPLGRYPMLMFLNGVGVLFGTTKAIIDEAWSQLAAKRNAKGEPLLSLTHVTRELMHAKGLYEAAHGMVYELCAEIDGLLFSGGDVSSALQGRAATATVVAAELCRKAADEVLPLTGSDHVFRSNPLNKLYADLRVGASHIVHRRDFLDRAALLHGIGPDVARDYR